MRILAFALQTERMTKEFFQGLSRRCGSDARPVFQLLAAREEEIAGTLADVKERFQVLDRDSAALDEAAAAIAAIFRDHASVLVARTEIDAYTLAVRVEHAVVAVFERLLAAERDAERRKLLGRVVATEEKRLAEVEGVRDFVMETQPDVLGAEAAGGMEI